MKYDPEVRRSEDTGLWVSRCPVFGIRSQGRTRKEALRALADSSRMYHKYCARRDILHLVLARQHAVFQPHGPTPLA